MDSKTYKPYNPHAYSATETSDIGEADFDQIQDFRKRLKLIVERNGANLYGHRMIDEAENLNMVLSIIESAIAGISKLIPVKMALILKLVDQILEYVLRTAFKKNKKVRFGFFIKAKIFIKLVGLILKLVGVVAANKK